MITPFQPTGIGQVDAINVFRVTFSTALSAIPVLTAYDSYQANSNTNTIFSGTAYLAYPMIAGVGGTAPGAANWFPASPTAGNTNAGTANMLNGSTNGCKLAGATPGAGGSVVFNLGYKFPYDVTTLATMDHVIAVEYQYTGAAPTVTFAGNEGSEGTPSWTTIDALTTGTAPTTNNVTQVRPCDTGTGSDGDSTYRQTIPTSGVSYPNEIWLKNY